MVRAREILSPIPSSFRFTGLIIFALDPPSARFWVTSPPSVPNSRALWTVKFYLLDIAIGKLDYSRWPNVFARAQAFVALSESFYLITPPSWPYRPRDSRCAVWIVGMLPALMPSPRLASLEFVALWLESGSTSRSSLGLLPRGYSQVFQYDFTGLNAVLYRDLFGVGDSKLNRRFLF